MPDFHGSLDAARERLAAAQSAGLVEAFDRLAVPSWIRQALSEVVADAWQAGYESGVNDGSSVFDYGRTPNPYRVAPPADSS